MKVTRLTSLHGGQALLRVYECPIEARSYFGRSYANVKSDCGKCEFFLGEQPSDLPDEARKIWAPLFRTLKHHSYLLCAGHVTIRRVGLMVWKTQRDAKRREADARSYVAMFGTT